MGRIQATKSYHSSVLLMCDFFPSGEEFQAASGIRSRTVEGKAVNKAPPGGAAVSD